MTVATCENSTYQCGSVTREYEASNNSGEVLDHKKNNVWLLTVDGIEIVLSKRLRNFSLNVASNAQVTDAKFIPADTDSGYAFCYTRSGTDSAIVSEDATFIDSELYFCSPAMGVVFWKERKDTCAFSAASADMAEFLGSWGALYFHKIKIEQVIIDTVETYYLLVNGVKEVIETVTSQQVYKERLYIVWPMPPSLATVWDTDLKQYGFYDYNAGGPDEALVMAQKEGGKDFYYPEWLQWMGVNKTQDQQDADDRFYAYYLGDGDQPKTLTLPAVPYSTPEGSAVKDADGNIALSFTAAKQSVNRIYAPDGTFTDVSSLFSKPHIYPVGVI